MTGGDDQDARERKRAYQREYRLKRQFEDPEERVSRPPPVSRSLPRNLRAPLGRLTGGAGCATLLAHLLRGLVLAVVLGRILDLARGDLGNQDRVADHVCGALLAFGFPWARSRSSSIRISAS